MKVEPVYVNVHKKAEYISEEKVFPYGERPPEAFKNFSIC